MGNQPIQGKLGKLKIDGVDFSNVNCRCTIIPHPAPGPLFPTTPEDLVTDAIDPVLIERMLDKAKVFAGQRVLIPYGAIGPVTLAAVDRKGTRVVAVEEDEEKYNLYKAGTKVTNGERMSIVQYDFLSLEPETPGTFDAVVLVLPAEGGREIKTHGIEASYVKHAYDFLGQGGVLVAYVRRRCVTEGATPWFRLRGFLSRKKYKIESIPVGDAESRMVLLTVEA